MSCSGDSDFLLSGAFQKPMESQTQSPEMHGSSRKSVFFGEVVVFVATLLLWFVSKYRIAERKKKSIAEDLAKTEGGRQRKIPKVSHFPNFPVKLPNFVNGFYTLYRTQKDGLQFIDELAANFPSRFFEMPLGFGTALVVADPNIAQKILSSSDPRHLNKARHIYDVIFPDAFQDGLIVSEYAIWSAHRKVLARSFTYKSLQTYLPFMNEHGKNLVGKLDALCVPEEGDTVEGKLVNDLIWAETIKIIIQTIMGEDYCSYEESLRIHDYFKRGKSIVQYRLLHPALLIEPIWWIHPMRRELDHIIKSLRVIGGRQIDKFRQRKELEAETEKDAEKAGDEGEDENGNGMGMKGFRCMMEEMLRAGASDKEIYDEMGTFVNTGHETTTLAINQLLFHLACNQDCQALCREEIDALLEPKTTSESDPDYNLSMDDLHELKYLERCILESLRLTTVTPVFLRRLDAPLKIDERLTLEEGRTILFSPWVMHRDPEIYPNPLKFDPDRFLPENVKGRHPYAFMPFSAGPRNCIGYKFAVQEIKVIMGWLLRQFEVFSRDRPENVRYFLELSLMPEKDINIILRRRKPVA